MATIEQKWAHRTLDARPELREALRAIRESYGNDLPRVGLREGRRLTLEERDGLKIILDQALRLLRANGENYVIQLSEVDDGH